MTTLAGDVAIDRMRQPGVWARRRRWLRFALLAALLALLQIPFLAADADDSLGWSRGAWTDEGLYTSQVRNASITGQLDLAESDGVVKEPLFALAAWVVLGIFGDSMIVMRAAVMLACTVLLAAMASRDGDFGRLLRWAIPAGVLSRIPFHYGHLALAELPCCLLLIASLGFLHARLRGGRGWTLAAAAGCTALAYAIKFQFAYAAVLSPVALLLAAAMARLSGARPDARLHARDAVRSVAWAMLPAAAYALTWLWPNRALLGYILRVQSAERTSALRDLPWTVLYNLRRLGADHAAWPVALLLGVGLVVAALAWRRPVDGGADGNGASGHRTAWIALMAPTVGWLLIESHRLSLGYLPSRYVVSLMLAAVCVGAAGLVSGQWPRSAPAVRLSGWRTVGSLCYGVAVALNCVHYASSLHQRRFAVRDMQTALAADAGWRGKVVVGPWAPALFWGTGAVTVPVWRHYFNDRDILRRLQPAAIVTEPDEGDSSQAFRHDGVALPVRPTHTVRVHDWQIDVHDLRGAAPPR